MKEGIFKTITNKNEEWAQGGRAKCTVGGSKSNEMMKKDKKKVVLENDY